ncbi:MAG: DUF2782 domain-containing protein [Gammaproteobacteria bacterium]
MKISLTSLVLGLLLGMPCLAEDQAVPEQFVEVPPPPPIITKGDDGEQYDQEDLEPEVTIINREDATYEEYRLNGRLYMVKVVPVVGPAYYYVDRDGDGLMETRRNDRRQPLQVPQWVIFSW